MFKSFRKLFPPKKISNDPLNQLVSELDQLLKFVRKVQSAIDKNLAGSQSLLQSKDNLQSSINIIFPSDAIENTNLLALVEYLGGLLPAREHLASDSEELRLMLIDVVQNVNNINKRLLHRRVAYTEKLHYENKLRKRQGKIHNSKTITPSDSAKLDRTQRKCGDALDDFTRIDDEVQHELQSFLAKKHEIASNIISKFTYSLGSYFSYVYTHYDHAANGINPLNSYNETIQPNSFIQNNEIQNQVVDTSQTVDLAEQHLNSNSNNINNNIRTDNNSSFGGVEFASRRQQTKSQKSAESLNIEN